MSLSRAKSLALLLKCVGNEIWSEEVCRSEGLPEDWIDELADAFESGFQSDRQMIYVGESKTNQFHGVRDVDLAIRIGRLLGVDVKHATEFALDGPAAVAAIKSAVMDGD
jgi:hypothetical protein